MIYLKQFYDAAIYIYMEMAPYMLLGMFVTGLLHIFLPESFLVKHTGKPGFLSILKSSLIGVPLPLCSCGVIPTAKFMSSKGASKGAVVSFITSTPQTGMDSIIATYGLLGPVFAIFRPVTALLSGIISGMVAEKTSNKEIVEEETCNGHCSCGTGEHKPKNKITEMFDFMINEFLDDVSFELIIGIIISAFITILIPGDFAVKLGINTGLIAMLIMGLAGIPIYVCATTSIPIAISFMMKGFSPGAVFVFLTTGPLTNAATVGVISKIIGKKSTAIYIATTFILSIISAFILDWIFKLPGITLPVFHEMGGNLESYSKINIVSSIIFGILLLFIFGRKLKRRF